MDCPPPRKKKLGQYNIEYFQYHIKRLENEVISLTQALSMCELNHQHMEKKNMDIQRKLKCRELQLEQYKKRITKLQDVNQQLKTQTMATVETNKQKEIIHIQRKLKCSELQLEQYNKRIAKLENTNQQLKDTLAQKTKVTKTLQNENEMLNKTLRKQKQFNETEIYELKQRLKLQSQTIKSHSAMILKQKKIIYDANDSDESENDDAITLGEDDSSVSESEQPNTQDKLFNATPDDVDKRMLGNDSDYDPMEDEDESTSSYD